MSHGINRITLLGHLGADPELKHLEGGQAVLNFRMATSHSYLDRNQVRQEATEWHSVSVWSKRGEALAKLLHKGSQVYVEGRMQTRKYMKENVQCYSTSVIATEVVLTGARGGAEPAQPRTDTARPKSDGQGRHSARAGNADDAATKGQEDFAFADDPGGDDEIPF